ncbi:hypothetical protein C8R44DRAFT_853337 [Mycena epipterygia]|nr:hypothetical protein C8R44DRAFT_853337 [Mycena epipterygia]
MLHIPSSVFTVFYFSSKGLVGLFGGFCVGAQIGVSLVLSGSLKSSLRATRTIETVLLPTKCVYSTASISFPYVAAMGYATVIFASLFCILRAKGFNSTASSGYSQSLPSGHLLSSDDPTPEGSTTSNPVFSPPRNHNGVGSQPPSPPPEPGSSCSTGKAPRKKGWVWLLWLVSMIFGIAGLVKICIFYLTGLNCEPLILSVFTSFGLTGLSVLERCFFTGWLAATSCISIIKIYFTLHALHHSKLVLLALVSHLGFIVIHRRSSRPHRSLTAVRTWPCVDYRRAVFLGSVGLLVCFSPLHWVLWAISVVIILTVNSKCMVLFLVILGPAIIHLAILGRRPLFLGLLNGFLCTARVIRRLAVSVYRRPLRFLLDCIRRALILAMWTLLPLLWCLCVQYNTNREIRDLLGRYPFLSPGWMQSVEMVYRILVVKYRAVKSLNITTWRQSTDAGLHTARTAFDVCFETWSVLGGLQKLAIVLPATAYYSYFHVASGINAEVAAPLWFAVLRPIDQGDARSKQQEIHHQDRRRSKRAAAGAAMGTVGDALPFSPPAALSTSPSPALAPLRSSNNRQCSFVRFPTAEHQVIPAAAHLVLAAPNTSFSVTDSAAYGHCDYFRCISLYFIPGAALRLNITN